MTTIKFSTNFASLFENSHVADVMLGGQVEGQSSNPTHEGSSYITGKTEWAGISKKFFSPLDNNSRCCWWFR